MATKKEKVVKKIHGLMEKWGVTPDELEEFGKDLDIELEDTDFEDDQLPVEGEITEVEEPSNEEPSVDVEGVETIEETVDEPQLPVETETQEEQPELPPVEPTPAEPVEVPQPTATPEQVADLTQAVEGLRNRVDSLFDALSKAGVLLVDENPVGVDTSHAPANDAEESFDDVLGELNKGRKYY